MVGDKCNLLEITNSGCVAAVLSYIVVCLRACATCHFVPHAITLLFVCARVSYICHLPMQFFFGCSIFCQFWLYFFINNYVSFTCRLIWAFRVSSSEFTCVSPCVFFSNGCNEEGYEEGSCTFCTCGPPSHEEGSEGKGNQSNQKVKDGSMKKAVKAKAQRR